MGRGELTRYSLSALSNHAHAYVRPLSASARRILTATASTVSAMLSTHSQILTRSWSSVDLVGPELIKFGIESKYSCPKTSTKMFMATITRALLDLQSICLQGLSSHL